MVMKWLTPNHPLERTAAAVYFTCGRASRVRRRGRSTALRYVAEPMAAEEEQLERQTVQPRNLVVEIIGTIVSMILGAFLGLMTGGNGLGYVSFIVLCSFMGWVMWTRRKQSFVVTICICVLLVILWWPFGLMIRDLSRGS